MNVTWAMRLSAAAAAIGGLALIAATAVPAPAQSQANFVNNGEAGFVVSDFGYVLAGESEELGSCPDGRVQTYRDVIAATPEGARQEGEGEQDYMRRMFQLARPLSATPDGQGACLNPSAAPPMPHHVVTGANIAIDGGIDLDGQVSRAGGRPAAGTCAHDDFRTTAGERGVDNQFYRVVGCINGYQPSGSIPEFDTEMLTGAWGILISLRGVDDVRNDNDVEVGVYANADPIQLSPNREPVPNATYAVTQNPRQRATTRGRIVNGVLTTDTFEFRIPKITNAMIMERSLRDARIRATISADGALQGYIAGYTMVDDMYDFQFGFRSAVDPSGQPARARAGSAGGSAGTIGYTCQGVYAALQRYADGHRDPATGRCTSISTQYRFSAIPAFVVDGPTQGTNSDLTLSSDE